MLMEEGCTAVWLCWQNMGAQTGWASASVGKMGDFTGISVPSRFRSSAGSGREQVRCMPVPRRDNLPLISSPVPVIQSIIPVPSLAAFSFSKCKSAEIFFFPSAKRSP